MFSSKAPRDESIADDPKIRKRIVVDGQSVINLAVAILILCVSGAVCSFASWLSRQ